MGAFSPQNNHIDNIDTEVIDHVEELVSEEQLIEFVNTELRSEYQTKFVAYKNMLTTMQDALNEQQPGAGNSECFGKLLSRVTIVIDDTLPFKDQNILLDKIIDKIDFLKQRFVTALAT